MELLNHNLSAEQRGQFTRRKYFEVTGGVTRARYRIRRASVLNVEELDSMGRCVRRLCVRPEGGLPLGDVLLSQKLALELFEAETLAVANADR